MGNYTFIGPDADDALKKYPGKVKGNPDVGFDSVSDAGMVSENPLKKTPKGYPNIGLSTPPPKPRETVLNIPLQAGFRTTPTQAPQPARSNIPTYAANISPASPLASGVLSTRAMRQGREIVTPSNQMTQPTQTRPQFKATLAGGINYQGDMQGNRTYSIGTPGQDGSGKMTVTPGTGTATPLAKMPPTSSITITGSAGDVERFNRPVGMTGPGTGKRSSLSAPPSGAQSWSDWYDGLGDAYDKRVGVAPKANTAAAPSMSELTKGLEGLGWKTRRDIILQRMKGADDVNVESMREAGADKRMALAQGVEMEKFMGQNDIARKTLESSKKFDQARIGTEEINQQKGQAEVEALNQIKAARDAYMKNPTPETEGIYRALIGKFEREAQYGVVKKYDDMGNVVGEQLFNKQTGEPKTDSGQGANGQQYEYAPSDVKKRKPGKVYDTPKGPLKWTGEGWDDEF